ncbi:MAG: carbonic anhydrase [Desulfamplus sp.]|nr:carbonic anhydrase [Desulfamplus sp.]
MEYLNQVLENIATTDNRPVKKSAADDGENPFAAKISSDIAIAKLIQGNIKFAKGESTYPNLDLERRLLAATESQAAYAFATVLSCSDSRVPVEAIFDAGVMDIFVVRVAGNVCDVDERASIEYGLTHVNTPVLVVMGHTQCGAVTAVTHAIQGRDEIESNLLELVDNIQPAVKKAIELNPDVKGDDIIPIATEENVWTSIEDLFIRSPVTRELVTKGYVKVVGAVYDIGTGNINWLSEEKPLDILAKVEASPEKAGITSCHTEEKHHGNAVKEEKIEGAEESAVKEDSVSAEESTVKDDGATDEESAVKENGAADETPEATEEDNDQKETPQAAEPVTDKA